MSIERHRNIADYTLSSMKRRLGRNLATIFVFVLVVFVLASVVMMMNALTREAEATLSLAPDITVQKLIAGRQGLVPSEYAEEIAKINGVTKVVERVWGYYYDAFEGATYTIIGVDLEKIPRLEDLELSIEEGRFLEKDGEKTAVIGRALADLMDVELGDKLLLVNSRGDYEKFMVVGIFSSKSNLQSADLIVMRSGDAREFFGLPQGYANDLGIEVANPAELQLIAQKIATILPDTRVLSRDQIQRTYDAIFGWRAGMFLAAMLGALLAFAILVWDRATSMTAEEKREIGILKALGWTTSDVLEIKSLEGLVLALNSYLLGVILAYIHVFLLGAPLLKPVLLGWSTLYPDFYLTPSLNLQELILIFFISVVPFMAAIIIPAWRASIIDPDVAMRGI
jgi:ABC-type lipoprotein release transport system permease subunit